MFAKKMPDLANMYMLAMSEAWGLASLEDVDAVMVMCVQFPEVQKHAACISFWQRDSLKEGEESAGVVLVSEPLPVL
ncbi:hypothetical protein KKC88_01215 [Patescibacteria group bacterium]|nr:hypothetical protein [Patescibacteria group bacterium]MBU1672851.1 hypothetical protein [Patescibacteria group bacterium]MBU1963728.1 hypothetical protein [Patescibacteria group bacterium]